GPFESGRDRRNARRAVAVAVLLPIPEEEGLVFPDRPAQRSAELVLDKVGPRVAGAVLKEVVRIELLVSQKLISRAVQLVRPGLDADVDDRARGAAEFGGEFVGLDAELLRRVYRRNEGG